MIPGKLKVDYMKVVKKYTWELETETLLILERFDIDAPMHRTADEAIAAAKKQLGGMFEITEIEIK